MTPTFKGWAFPFIVCVISFGEPAGSGMRPDIIVIIASPGEFAPNRGKSLGNLLIHQLIAETAIEATSGQRW